MNATDPASGSGVMDFFRSFCDAANARTQGAAMQGYRPCFEDVVLLGVATCAFLMVALFRMLQLCRWKSPENPATPNAGVWACFNHNMRLACHAVCMVVPLLLLYARGATEQIPPYRYVVEALVGASWGFSAVAISWERKVGYAVPGEWLLPFCWVWTFAANMARVESQQLLADSNVSITIVKSCPSGDTRVT